MPWVTSRRQEHLPLIDALTPQYGGFPKLGVPFWGVLIIRIMVFWGSILGFPYSEKLPYRSLDPIGFLRLIMRQRGWLPARQSAGRRGGVHYRYFFLTPGLAGFRVCGLLGRLSKHSRLSPFLTYLLSPRLKSGGLEPNRYSYHPTDRSPPNLSAKR